MADQCPYRRARRWLPHQGEQYRRGYVVDGPGAQPFPVHRRHRLAEDADGQTAGGQIGDRVRGAGLQRDHRLHLPCRARLIEDGAQPGAGRHADDRVGEHVPQRDPPPVGQRVPGRYGRDEALADDGQCVEAVGYGASGTDQGEVDGAGTHLLQEPVGVPLEQ